MPSVKKSKSKISEENNVDIMEEEEIDDEMSEILKQNYKLEHFLECEVTRNILEQDSWDTFEYNCLDVIDEFYQNEREEFRDALSTLFYYDICGDFVCHLKEIIMNNVTLNYDLEIFYDNPNLAKPLLDNYNEIQKEKLKQHRENIVNNYKENNNNDGKTFNWTTKTYK